MKKQEYLQPELYVLELVSESNLLFSGNASGQDLGSPVIPDGDYTDFFNNI
ncbi:MAG: hypothetical protein J5745_03125 [Bacteroidales bacterium]|nr:hypothetical protein [Bacteroidales bacterium]